MFGFKRKQAPIAHVRHDPLAAVPLVPTGVTAQPLPDGGVELCRVVPPKSRLYAWVARRLRYDQTVRIRLDARGAAFWTAVDGRRSVRGLAETLAPGLELDGEAARQCVVKYIGELMRRGWLLLKLDLPAQPGAAPRRTAK